MRYLSDSGAVRVDIRVDYQETFYRRFQVIGGNLVITSDHDAQTVPINFGTITDWAYYDAELLIWYYGQDKILENFNFTNGKLSVSGAELIVNENLTTAKGVYRYHLMIETPASDRKILIKGNFIYKKE